MYPKLFLTSSSLNLVGYLPNSSLGGVCIVYSGLLAKIPDSPDATGQSLGITVQDKQDKEKASRLVGYSRNDNRKQELPDSS